MTTKPPVPAAPPRQTLLVLLTALSVLPVNIHLPALPDIAADLRADPALVNLSVAGYAMVTALTELISGALSGRYGRRPIALVAISVFVVASISCALAPDIHLFLDEILVEAERKHLAEINLPFVPGFREAFTEAVAIGPENGRPRQPRLADVRSMATPDLP